MSNAETLNQYIKELFDYWNEKNDDFEPIQIPKEVDDEMQRDSFYYGRNGKCQSPVQQRKSEADDRATESEIRLGVFVPWCQY